MRKLIILSMAAATLAAGCSTNPYTGERRVSRVGTSAAGGAAAGAAAGAVLGEVIGDRAGKGAAIGAGVGALAGLGIGAYQERQLSKLREQLAGTGVSVTKDGDNIFLNMPSDVTFNVDQADIRPAFYDKLNSVALIFQEYDKTTVTIRGHADSTGSDAYNQQLSERRALSVSRYISSQGVEPARLRALGFGESAPIASNDSEAGRAANRRVEIVIDPIESRF
ncbi:MAG: OmpA family protein [Pseudomonadota bacterium]